MGAHGARPQPGLAGAEGVDQLAELGVHHQGVEVGIVGVVPQGACVLVVGPVSGTRPEGGLEGLDDGGARDWPGPVDGG